MFITSVAAYTHVPTGPFSEVTTVTYEENYSLKEEEKLAIDMTTLRLNAVR